MRELVDLVEDVTGVRFVDLGLLQRAFTHTSWAHEHPGARPYERLEFLGDAVVGLCVTRMLVEAYPELREGKLSAMRQKVVNTRALGVVGREMGLAPHIRLGGSERGKDRVEVSIVGDVVEALFAAVFQAEGLDAAQAMARRWLEPAVLGQRERAAADRVQNPKNRLQEHTQEAFDRALPVYEVVEEIGPDNDREFRVRVSVGGRALAEGTGRRRKEAEKNAAHMALIALGVEEGA